MSWTPLTPLLHDSVRRHQVKPAVLVSLLIDGFNVRSAAIFKDPHNALVRGRSYQNGELTIFCKSPAYAAAVRERRDELIDPLRSAYRALPIRSLRFIFRAPDL